MERKLRNKLVRLNGEDRNNIQPESCLTMVDKMIEKL